MAPLLIIDEGLDWAFCDTDSLAIVKPDSMSEVVSNDKVERLRAELAKAAAYVDGRDFLKLALDLGVDRSNLSAMLAGRRPLSQEVRQTLRERELRRLSCRAVPVR